MSHAESIVVSALRSKPWIGRKELRAATELNDEELTTAIVRLTDAGQLCGGIDDKSQCNRRFIWNLTE